MKDYFVERNKKSVLKLSKLLEILPDFCFDFFIGIENHTSALTRCNYATDLTIFFQYISENKFKKSIKEISLKDLNSLQTIDIERFLNYIAFYENENGINRINSEKGKARKLASLRSFFKYYFNKEKLDSNIVARISTPKIHTKDIVRLEVDEVVKLLNEAENPINLTPRQNSMKNKTSKRDFALLSLLLGTGIRVSECVGLNISDIDFENNAFKVTRKGGNQVLLYFSDEVKEPLQTWIIQRNEMMKGIEDDNSLFISLQKKRITVRAVENLVKKYSQIASPLKKISPHKLRSTYGTNLYKETQDIYIVAEVLGHKDVNTTKKHYAAISEDIRRNAANKVKLRN